MKKFTMKNYPPTESGEWVSEIIDGDIDGDDAYADDLQPDCSHVADDLQPVCNHVADDLQPVCRDSANNPQQPKRRPNEPINAALVAYLADDGKFAKSTYGWFSDVEDLAANQQNAPKYLCKYLNDIGFNTNVDQLTRVYLPEARVTRTRNTLNRQIKAWQKVSAVLVILLIVMWMSRPANTAANGVGEYQRPKGSADSAITWRELNDMLAVYNRSSNVKIWYAPPLYQLINEKNITDVNEIKKLFDQRAEEIKRLQGN